MKNCIFLNNVSFERQTSLAIKFIEHSHLSFRFPLNDSERGVTTLPHVTGGFESINDGSKTAEVTE